MNALLAALAAPLVLTLQQSPVADPSAHESIPQVAQAQPTPEWYGWQPLFMDMTAVGLFALAGATGKAGPVPGSIGGALYVFGGPAAHFAHHNYGRGVADFLLRTAAPIGAGLLVAEATPCTGECWNKLGAGAVAVVSTMAVVAVIDWTLLSWER